MGVLQGVSIELLSIELLLMESMLSQSSILPVNSEDDNQDTATKAKHGNGSTTTGASSSQQVSDSKHGFLSRLPSRLPDPGLGRGVLSISNRHISKGCRWWQHPRYQVTTSAITISPRVVSQGGQPGWSLGPLLCYCRATATRGCHVPKSLVPKHGLPSRFPDPDLGRGVLSISNRHITKGCQWS